MTLLHIGVAAHDLEGSLSSTDRPHTVVNSARTQPGLCNHESAVLRAQQVVEWNPAIVILNFTMPAATRVTHY